jgi:hypothetical protein
MSDLTNPIHELDDTWKVLLLRWGASKEVWQDAVQQEFEQQHWMPLEEQTRAVQRELEALAQVIHKARRVVK